MTLDEFVAAEKKLTLRDACDLYNLSAGDFLDETVAVYTYKDDSYIEELADGSFFVLLDRDMYVGDKGKIAGMLHDWWIGEFL